MTPTKSYRTPDYTGNYNFRNVPDPYLSNSASMDGAAIVRNEPITINAGVLKGYGSGEEVEIIGMQDMMGRRNLAAENLVPVYVTDTMGNPLFLANVAELDDDNRVIGGTTTTSEGVAYVNAGRFRVSYVGYKPEVVEVGGTGLDVQLMQNNNQLSEFTVTGKRPNYWPIVALALVAIGVLVLTAKSK